MIQKYNSLSLSPPHTRTAAYTHAYTLLNMHTFNYTLCTVVRNNLPSNLQCSGLSPRNGLNDPHLFVCQTHGWGEGVSSE